MTSAMTKPTPDPEQPIEAIHNAESIKQRWAKLIEEEPSLRIRDAAARLGVSEAHLLATRVGEDVVRLRCDVPALFEGFTQLGELMASTRNHWAVIEKTGSYDHLDIGEHVGLVLNEQIDLRLFPVRFKHAYAQTKVLAGGKRVLRSVQCFCAQGHSLHKVYLEHDASIPAYEVFVERLKHPEQSAAFIPAKPQPYRATVDDVQVDVEAFRQAWRELKDTHEFFGLLRRFELDREQAFRLAPPELTQQVDASSLTTALNLASMKEVPIMVFVASEGCIEIHTGPIKKVVERGSWINVLDRGFNLHVNREGIVRGWIVRKPTVDGVVTSLELFDHDGKLVLMMFGERKPGIAEDERWRALVKDLLT